AYSAQIFEQTGPGVYTVVEPIPALFEEDVAAHFSGQQRAGRLHFGLDQRMPGLPQQRFAAMAAYPREQVARRLHVEDDAGARVSGQYVGGEQHELAVRIDDLAGFGDYTQPIAVAVEREPQLLVAIAQSS